MRRAGHGALAPSVAGADPDEAPIGRNYTIRPMGTERRTRDGRHMLRQIATGYTMPFVLFAAAVALIVAHRAEGLAWSALVISLALGALRAGDASKTPGPQGGKAGAR
jgi:hypothetical protein